MTGLHDNGGGLTVFLVVGKLPKSLTVSKAEPIARSRRIGRVLVFRRERGYTIRGATYVTLPSWITKLPWKPLMVLVRTLAEYLQLQYFAWRLKPDIIHAVGVLPCGAVGFAAAKLSGVRNLISIIGGSVEITTYRRWTAFWTRFNLWLLRRSTAVTTTGSRLSSYLRGCGIEGEKIYELGGSVDTARFCPGEGARDIDILFVGTFRRLKGPDRVLDVVERLRDEFPSLRAYFLGAGYFFTEIYRRVEVRGLGTSVVLTGHVDDPLPYYRRGKLILMPSRSEGLSIAMLEAMACGCVPIVSNVGNTADAALHEVTAMVVEDYHDVDAFTRHARALLLDAAAREKIARNARELVEARYSVAAQAGLYDRMLDPLLGNGNGRERRR